MITDRMKPDEPSSAPATISELVLEHEAHRHRRQTRRRSLSSEITVGMSAPPIGMIRSTPNSSESANDRAEQRPVRGIHHYTHAAHTAVPSSAKFTAFWPR